MLFVSEALASTAQPPSQSSSLFLMVIIFFVFYMFLIRPHKKQLQEHKNKISAIKKGDVIVTSGGIMGKVVKLQDDEVIHVKISENTIIQIVKSTVSDIVDKKFTPLGEVKSEKTTKKKGK